jgi:predicted RNase H-like HicB family nuclease
MIGETSYTVTFERDDDGSWYATVDDLPGVFASGFTAAELEAALDEAISMYLTDGGRVVEFHGKPGQLAAAIAAGEHSLDRVAV